MGTSDLSVQVLNISPRATKEELIVFFSYCGTIDEIQLQRDGDKSQLAVITFRQPYAYQTALLLNDAIIVDRQVRILPLENGSWPIIICTSETKHSEDGKGSILSTSWSSVNAQEISNKEIDRALDTSRARTQELAQQVNMMISAAEQTLGCCIAKSSTWLSNVIDRASKSVVELGNSKARNPNSRKQK